MKKRKLSEISQDILNTILDISIFIFASAAVSVVVVAVWHAVLWALGLIMGWN